MNVLHTLWDRVKNDSHFMKTVHGWLTVIWFVASVPIMIWWSENIKFLVWISVYAVVTGHFSSWQSARVEVKQDAATPTTGGVM